MGQLGEMREGATEEIVSEKEFLQDLIMLKWLNGDVSDKGKIGITFGCMDLLHAGHVAMLAEAKQNCDCLLYTSPSPRD